MLEEQRRLIGAINHVAVDVSVAAHVSERSHGSQIIAEEKCEEPVGNDERVRGSCS